MRCEGNTTFSACRVGVLCDGHFRFSRFRSPLRGNLGYETAGRSDQWSPVWPGYHGRTRVPISCSLQFVQLFRMGFQSAFITKLPPRKRLRKAVTFCTRNIGPKIAPRLAPGIARMSRRCGKMQYPATRNCCGLFFSSSRDGGNAAQTTLNSFRRTV